MHLRFLDLFLSAVGIVVLSPLFVFIALILIFDTGSPVFRQERVGRNRKVFKILKFRSMRLDSLHVATHLADQSLITTVGKFLRRTKLDELPQLFNVLRGQMSLVGPRPCLPNQQELINARDALGVFDVRPGITGLAQLSRIDMSTPRLLAQTDKEMMQSLNLKHYLKYVVFTILGKADWFVSEHKKYSQ